MNPTDNDGNVTAVVPSEESRKAPLRTAARKTAAKTRSKPAPLAAASKAQQTDDGSPVALRPLDGLFNKGGLKIVTLAKAVESAGPIASDDGGGLYYYKDGLWHPNGDREVHRRASILLGQRYRPAHGANVSKWFAVQHAKITDTNINTDLLNLPNGLLDWKTGKLQPWSPEVNCRARIPVEWDQDATCPTIDAWVREVVTPDCVDLLYEITGYSLFNGNPLHKAVLPYGSGRNGKGTWLRLLMKLAGSVNCTAISPQALDENRFMSAELHGKLVNLVGDVDPRIFKATETFKKATGGDLITAERKHGQPFDFTCRALMICAFNAFPRSADATEGFFSRWIVLPFIGYFPAGIADPSIEPKLQDDSELRGFLVAAVEGLRRVMSRGCFLIPESVREATTEFREAADPVRAFVTDCLQAGRLVIKPDVYAAWKTWCDENGTMPGSARRFYGNLVGAARDVLGVDLKPKEKSHGRECFRGVELIPTPSVNGWKAE